MKDEKNFTYFGVKMDLDALDEKLQWFVMLRNGLVMLAKEIGFEVESELLELKKPAPDITDQEQETIAVEFNGEELAKSVWKAIHGKLPECGE